VRHSATPQVVDALVPAAGEALAALRAAQLTAATAESVTGGLVAAALTEVAGSSQVVRGGVVAYDAATKHRLLRVPEALLVRHGPVHPEVAAWMARGACAALGAPVGVATTGVAGPQSHGGQPVGTVYFGWRCRRREGVVCASLAGDRRSVRRAAAHLALVMLAHCGSQGAVDLASLPGGGPLSDVTVTLGQ
jgi:nicotinamide-nucleotide amidase